jgi:Lrp/AsnC family leucine-responsive transcriptional regulator
MEDSKLSLSDLIILKNLSKNSRTSLKDLATKASISKQAMHKRLKKIEVDYIKKYVTLIDYGILGYNTIQIYFKIQGINRREYRKKISELQKIEKVVWISNFIGEYDIGISIMYKTIDEINKVISRVYQLFKGYVKNKEWHLIKNQYVSPILSDEQKEVICFEKDKEINISNIDRKIIESIKHNPRFILVDISSKIGINHKTLQKHIMQLEKNKVIKGYGVLLNYRKLGYEWNICILNITPGSNLSSLLNLLKKENNVPFISTTIENNIIFDYVSKDYNELKEFLDKLQIEFSKIIDTYKILSVLNLEKLSDSRL